MRQIPVHIRLHDLASEQRFPAVARFLADRRQTALDPDDIVLLDQFRTTHELVLARLRHQMVKTQLFQDGGFIAPRHEPHCP